MDSLWQNICPINSSKLECIMTMLFRQISIFFSILNYSCNCVTQLPSQPPTPSTTTNLASLLHILKPNCQKYLKDCTSGKKKKKEKRKKALQGEDLLTEHQEMNQGWNRMLRAPLVPESKACQEESTFCLKLLSLALPLPVMKQLKGHLGQSWAKQSCLRST